MAQLDRPVHEVRLGKVKAAIWRNETDLGARYSVTISRIYKTESGWESSGSFGRDELPLVGKVADLAHSWIYQLRTKIRRLPMGNASELAVVKRFPFWKAFR